MFAALSARARARQNDDANPAGQSKAKSRKRARDDGDKSANDDDSRASETGTISLTVEWLSRTRGRSNELFAETPQCADVAIEVSASVTATSARGGVRAVATGRDGRDVAVAVGEREAGRWGLARPGRRRVVVGRASDAAGEAQADGAERDAVEASSAGEGDAREAKRAEGASLRCERAQGGLKRSFERE